MNLWIAGSSDMFLGLGPTLMSHHKLQQYIELFGVKAFQFPNRKNTKLDSNPDYLHCSDIGYN
jgi:hypothetical protein